MCLDVKSYSDISDATIGLGTEIVTDVAIAAVTVMEIMVMVIHLALITAHLHHLPTELAVLDVDMAVPTEVMATAGILMVTMDTGEM